MARPQLPVDQISKAAIRKRAQRALALDGATCSRCGSPTSLERHHHDYAQPTAVTILCRSCHRDQDEADGTWTPDRVQAANCKVCGTTFQPTRSRRAVLCGSLDCLKAFGKLNAERRWKGETTSCARSEMESYRSRLRSQLSCLLGEPGSSADAVPSEARDLITAIQEE